MESIPASTQEVFMRYRFELLLVCLSLTALASCAREDDELARPDTPDDSFGSEGGE